MIAICCAPRCGGSLLMQTLSLLGIPMAAPAFIPEHDNIREFNPNGFYEFNDMEGIKSDVYKGMAVKLYGKQLFDTPKHLIDKLINIDRRKKDAVESYDRVRQKLPYCEHTSELIYDKNKELIHKSIDENTLILKLEWCQQYPSLFVLQLCTYLEINPTDEQFNNAVKNVTPCRLAH